MPPTRHLLFLAALLAPLAGCFAASSGGLQPDSSFAQPDGGEFDGVASDSEATDSTVDVANHDASTDVADASIADSAPGADAPAVDAAADASALADSAAESGGACDAGTTMCGSSCVDTMTDPINCGGCGLPCYSACDQGYCHWNLDTGSTFNGVTVAGGVVYFGSQNQVLAKVPPVGAATLVASGVNPLQIVISGSMAYVAMAGNGSNNGSVVAAPLDGGPQTTLVSGQNGPYALTVDANNVYFTNDYSTSDSIVEVPLDGGAPVTLAIDDAPGIVSDGTSLYFISRRSNSVIKMSPQLASDGGFPPQTVLASGLNSPNGIAIDSNSVYWTDQNGTSSTVEKVALDGGAVTTLASGLIQPISIAVDSSYVYFTILGLGTNAVQWVPLDGGAVTILSDTGQLTDDYGFGLAVDSKSIYYSAGPTVLQITPKP